MILHILMNTIHPSKYQSKRFVGDLPFDSSHIDEHNVYLNQYWTIYRTNSVICSAKVILLGLIKYISESVKPKSSSMLSNPNTQIILDMYEYDNSTGLYNYSWRSSLLFAKNLLHVEVTSHISMTVEGIYFNHSSIQGLAEYSPFHFELDIGARLASSLSINDVPPEENESDRFIVERIEKKHYNAHKNQFEYFVKWLGYSSKENTWELPSSQLKVAPNESRRAGLRERKTLKCPNKPDFILNM